MNRLLRLLVAGLLLTTAGLAHAETITIDVQHLAPDEAAQLAQTQLSPNGHVVVLASRHIVVIDDDAKHAAAARALIRRLDVAIPSLQVELQIDTVSQDDIDTLIAHGEGLPGGWLRLHADTASLDTYDQQDFTLRIRTGHGGRIEAGTVQPITAEMRQWLAAHGIPESETIETVPITAGFNIEARMDGSRHARVALHPWIRRQQQSGGVSGQPQVLIGLGTTGSPSIPPSTTAPDMRIYGQPSSTTDLHEIRISEADTDLTVPLDRWVTIGAVRASAGQFGQAMLSGQPNTTTMEVLIRLRVKPVR
jgi:hypothetical protein